LPVKTVRLPGIELEPIEENNSRLRSLSYRFIYTREREGLEGHIEYATELFDRATIERLIGHFDTFATGDCRGARESVVGAAAAGGIGAAPTAGGVERHGGRVSAGQMHPRIIRRTGSANP